MQPTQPPPPSSLAADVAAAAKALDDVAAAGGAARIVVKKDGGRSLLIQVSSDKKGEIEEQVEKAQSAMKTLACNSEAMEVAAEGGGAEGERERREEVRMGMLTPLMKVARDDSGGREVKKTILGIKRGVGGSKDALAKALNETEKEVDDDEEEGVPEKGGDATDDGTSRGKAPTKLPREGGWAAIHFACDSGNHEGLRFLLDAGADPNLTDCAGATALHRVILGAGKADEKNATAGVACSEDSSSRLPMPGVVKSNSSVGGISNFIGTGDMGHDAKYVDDYMKCLKMLLGHYRFDFMMNERRDEKYGDKSKQQSSFPCNHAASEQFKIEVGVLPEPDGLGISPLCLCVVQGYTSRDAMYPLLETLLTRGFDPNASMCGISALHIALRNTHYGCAFALTRAGANINAVHPDGKSALQAAELIYGESFARELREASVVALAVADPVRRRDLLRVGDGARKLAKRAMNAGHSFLQASRWREAAGAYSEAASYGPDNLPERERFECLRKMSECFLQVERGLKSEQVARQLLKEFPQVSLAHIAVGEAMSHPSCGKLTPAQLKEVSGHADEALKIEKKSDGKEWWRMDDNRSNSALLRALKLKGMVEGRTKEQNPAVKVANTALDEYFTPGGSIEKAAFAIELALKPDLKHPSPLPLHGIRGFIYYSWASEILRVNSLSRGDRERKDGLLRVMAPLQKTLSFKEAHQKIQIAFDEFEYYSKNNVNGEFPTLIYGFNRAKALMALGKFKQAKQYALTSIKARAQADLDRLDETGKQRNKHAMTTQEDHFEGGSTQKLILQLNWALDMNRMLVTQMVIDYAINADSSSKNELPSPILIEPLLDGMKLKDDVINMRHLYVILEKAIAYKLLDKTSEKALLEKISGDPIKINAAIRGILSAMKTLECGYQTMADLRVEVGKIIMNFVTGAHRMQRQTKSSSRVVGSLLMEAFEWDKNLKIPETLPKQYVKMAQDMGANIK